MKIARIEAYRVDIELERPFVIALGTIARYEGVIVRIVDDAGHEGWGEAAPRPTLLGETVQSVLGALERLAPLLVGQDPRCLGALISRMDRALLKNTSAKAALDVALHDLLGRAWGVPLRLLLGGDRDRFPTDFTIGLDEPEVMAREAKERVTQGFKILKLKLGEDPLRDVERVRGVREAVGSRVKIRIDANQGWTPPEAVRALNAIAAYDVELVEQPVAAHDLEGLAWVRRSQPIPVMADESIHLPEDAMRVVRLEAADYINIKLMKSGGFWKARQIAAIAEAAGLGCQVGGMVESDLGQAAAVHLACGLRVVRFGDLDMGFGLRQKLIVGGGARFDPEKGEMIAPESPGLGVEALDEELLGSPVQVWQA
jgi:L-alanine-DL-glutamate epimerase-like enolase superfamily enzyme